MPYDYDTSYPAFKEIESSKSLCRDIVFLAIEKLGVCNDREIADKLEWTINRITNRRLELLQDGRIKFLYKAIDSNSKRTVNYWSVTGHKEFSQQELFN